MCAFLANTNKNPIFHRIILITIFLIGLIFLLCLEHKATPLTKDGLRFQMWSSDTMWQSLNSTGLRNHPFKSLWYLHKEPPLYDAIRALLIGCFLQNTPDAELGSKLDRLIYILWAFCFSIMAVLIYHWLSRLTQPWFAFFISILWILHPAPIYYATYLDPTFLVSLGVLWLFYELWLLKIKSGSILRLSLSALFLFYLRATFTWHFFILLIACLMLMNISRKELTKFIIICTLFVTPYIIKQYSLFKITEVSFSGRHLYYLITGDNPPNENFQRIKNSVNWEYPKEAYLSVGIFNTKDAWQENFAYKKSALQYFMEHPFKSLKNILQTFYIHNWPQYWSASATFCPPHTAVELLPWSNVFNKYISYPISLWILIAAIIVWGINRWSSKLPLIDRNTLAILLILIYIFMPSTLVNGDGRGKTEAVRYKFFLEPVYFIFIASQFYNLCSRLRTLLSPKPTK